MPLRGKGARREGYPRIFIQDIEPTGEYRRCEKGVAGGRTLTANLYYANLGGNNPERTKTEVVRTLSEVEHYLGTSLRKMSDVNFYFLYQYDYIVVRFVVRTTTFKGFKAEPKRITLVNGENRETLRIIKFDEERGEAHLERFPFSGEVIGVFEGIDAEFYVKPVGARASQIKSIEERERAEEEALSFLFDQAEVVVGAVDPGMKETYGRMRIEESDRSNGILELKGTPINQKYLMAKYDTTVLRKEREAVQRLAVSPRPHHAPLLDLLTRGNMSKWAPFRAPDPDDPDEIKFYTLPNGPESDEDEEQTWAQKKFVAVALGTPDFAVLEGPPGSGKTTTILELVIQLIRSGKRVMMVASTHVAVDNILQRLLHPDSNDPERRQLMDVHGILPLRIGPESSVSPEIKQYCLENIRRTEAERLRKGLGAVKHRSKAQQTLYDMLNSDEENALSDMVVEMSNLVCGTMIGIMQAPMIKHSLAPSPLFDCLILDEASKTTFQEFLVPALYSRKWIISGDPKQLAPYVDREYLEDNLSSLYRDIGFGYRERQICMQASKACEALLDGHNGHLKRCRLITCTDQREAELLETQLSYVASLLEENGAGKLAIVRVMEPPDSITKEMEIASANVIITKEDIPPQFDHLLPPDLVLVDTENLPSETERRRVWWERHHSIKSSPRSEEDKEWEEEVAWRLCRTYELKSDQKGVDGLLVQIRALMPSFLKLPETWGWAKSEVAVLGEVLKIRRISMPSIIDILTPHPGMPGENKPADIPIHGGLPVEAFRRRHVLLNYQHRMHPEISEFPRRFVYADNALKDGVRHFKEHPGWPYMARRYWLPVRPRRNDLPKRGERKNYNLAEVKRLIDELKDFLCWTAENPKDDGGATWEIAILTFYTSQEKKIAQAISSQLNAKGYRLFRFPESNAVVEVCTVDRFQGHEADLVFLSFVRSRAVDCGAFEQNYNTVGFLDSENRLNVALTRARHQLLIVGNREFFMRERYRLLDALVKETKYPMKFGGENET